MIRLIQILKRSKARMISFVIVLFFLWLQTSPLSWMIHPIERLEALAYDFRLNLTLDKHQIDPRVVIVDIDEKSLQQIGQWPWPRNIIGDLVEKISARGAAVIGFDIVFPEEEKNSAEVIINQLQQIDSGDTASRTSSEILTYLDANRAHFDNNIKLAESLKEKDIVLGVVLDYREGEPIGILPEPPEFINLQGALDALDDYAATNYTANIPILQNATPSAGFFSLKPDIDGVIRRTPMLAKIDNKIYPSLSLEMIRLFKLIDEIEVITATIADETVIEGIRIGESLIPTNHNAQAIVPFQGGWGSFPYLSAAEILDGSLKGNSLEGAIVLIGTTAHGLFDLRSTPTGAVYPGVEIHANIIAGALDQSYPSTPAWGAGVNFLIALLIGSILALLLPTLAPLPMFINSLISLLAIGLFNFWLWQEALFIIDLALPVLMILSLSLFNIAYGFLYESASRNRLKGMFGQYVPPELVKEMSENPESSYGFEGESREMSVMFCDIRSFTSISEKLSAEELKNFLNQFFTPMTQIIFEHRGTIDKYVGDMIMAFWGAPLSDQEHAVHSVESALAMVEKCQQLDKTLSTKFNTQPIHIGVGINTGKMNVGDMGSRYRRSYTVLGDAVNMGSRFEALTKYYGVSLLIGEETHNQISDAYLCREIDKVTVKGKIEPVFIYQPIKLLANASSDDLDLEEKYRYCRSLFLDREWDAAKQAFLQLKQVEQSVICDRYLERIEQYQNTPPDPDWNGLFQHQQKSGG